MPRSTRIERCRNTAQVGAGDPLEVGREPVGCRPPLEPHTPKVPIIRVRMALIAAVVTHECAAFVAGAMQARDEFSAGGNP